MPIRETTSADDPAQAWALQALAWVLSDDKRAERFVAITGIEPADLRARAGEREVLDATLGFLEAHEPDLVACAEALDVAPIELVAARGSFVSKPLLITDCDEVLLHMVSHFRDWVNEAHSVDFELAGGDFSGALKRRPSGESLRRDEVWPLLDGFFQTEMHRQTLVPGAREALDRLGTQADIVVLTNLGDHFNEARAVQLAGHGIAHRVVTNQGGKGNPVAALIAEFAPSVTVFVDDLAHHHTSVATAAPDTFRLHMIAEPLVARVSPPAAAAHARIDDWTEAVPWIEARFAGLPLDG